ncbi:uncharacterized protein LOC105685947 [Athalia rosae]|uniref:uncharacterized protein LOC105685947 n=1 Tax=Athalia rosae TaxID=37344 RepID=UPI0020337CF9|nr:uncharacterized protein LOC105685947 [Athalia rosae]
MTRAEDQTFTRLIRTNVFLLKLSGMIPLDGEIFYNSILSSCLTIVSFSILMVHTCSFVYDVVIHAAYIETVVESFALIISFLGGLIRNVILYRSRGKVRAMIASFESLWKIQDVEERRLIATYVKNAKNLTYFFLSQCIVTIIFYAISPLFVKSEDVDVNATRLLPYAFFLEVHRSPYYEITYFLQVSSMLNVGFTCVGVDMIAPIFIMTACGHLRVIRGRLERIGRSTTVGKTATTREDILRYLGNNPRRNGGGSDRFLEPAPTSGLKNCLDYHMTILSICEEIERLTNVIFLTQLVGSTYILSTVGFKLSGNDQDKYKYSTQIIIGLVQLFICNWPSDTLSLESEAIARAVYSLPWYQWSNGMKRSVNITIMRAQKPVRLTAGKFIYLSLETFASMTSTAVSFFTMLRSLYTTSSETYPGRPFASRNSAIIETFCRIDTDKPAYITHGCESVATICEIQLISAVLWSNLIFENVDIIYKRRGGAEVNFRMAHLRPLARIMHMKKSFWEHFWLAKLCLQIVGIVNLNGPQTKWKIVLSKFLMVGPIICVNSVLYEQLHLLIYQKPTNDELVKITILLIPIFVIQCRAVMVIFNSIRLKRLITICEDLWNNSTPQEYTVIFRWGNRNNIIIKVSITCSVILSLSYLMNAIIHKFIAPSNGAGRYSLLSAKKIFTPSPWFEIYVTIQVILTFYSNFALASYDMMGPFMTLNMCGQLDLMTKWLVDISKNLSDASNLKFKGVEKMSLAKVIRKHQDVLELCAKIEEVSQYSILIKVVDLLYVIALTASRIMASSAQLGATIWYAVAVLYSSCGLFYVCWPAEMLSNSWDKVAKAVYEIPWYKLSKSDKKTVIIMLAQSQNPVILTAGKFVDLSLKTFYAVMSNSVSIYLVLRNL